MEGLVESPDNLIYHVDRVSRYCDSPLSVNLSEIGDDVVNGELDNFRRESVLINEAIE
jgi:hypothetical protein